MQPDNGPSDDGGGGAGGRKPWEKSNTLPHKSNNFNSSNGGSNGGSGGNGQGNGGSESPRPSRKRFGSASEETILKVGVNYLVVTVTECFDCCDLMWLLFLFVNCSR